jgi:hypothetical protein
MDYNEAVGFEHVFVRCAMRLNRPVWVTLARIYPLNTGPRPRFHYAQLAIDLSEQEAPGVMRPVGAGRTAAGRQTRPLALWPAGRRAGARPMDRRLRAGRCLA